MFSKGKQFIEISFVAKRLLKEVKSVDSVKYFSTKSSLQYDFPKDYSKELNIFRTFVPELRPDLIPESQKFNSLWPDVKRELLDYCRPICGQKTSDYISRALEYNCVGGKQVRAMQLVLGFKDIMDKSEQTPEMMHKVYMMGWAMELVIATAVANDDMIDHAWVRRGAPCWHRLPEVGLYAASDHLLLIHLSYLILAKHCRDLPSYKELFEYMWEGVIATHTGQAMDHVHFDSVLDFNTESSRILHIAAAGRFLFYTPLSMLFAIVGHKNRESIQLICDEMGDYYQSQNDFLDVFNIDGVLIKTSHDIEIGKCSWLSTTCMERANDEQKQIMVDNYGKPDPKCIERIKKLYVDMNLQQVYTEFAYEKYDYIKSLIEEANCEDSMKIVLFKINDLVFHRQITN